MTSDAKIGLLLGLVFIFAIAFIINGLPNFRGEQNNNELTSTMFNPYNEGLGLAAKERKVIEQNEPIMKYPAFVPRPGAGSDTRVEMPLPKNVSDKKETLQVKKVSPPKNLPAATSKEKRKTLTQKPTLPKSYIVAAGDNLSTIAKKFYGKDEGNRIKNVIRIFKANRKILKSADDIYEGQKIIIPPVPASDKDRIAGGLPGKMFEKVKSIGRIRVPKKRPKAGRSGGYVVRDGDSLWRIAAEHFGDGSRYGEIARLNADILDDEDYLSVGMRLRLPTR